MSHQNTPHLYNKRTPSGFGEQSNSTNNGSVVLTTSGNKNPAATSLTINSMGSSQNATLGSNTNPNKVALDASSTVSDSHAANAKQLLNAYVYDFLVKSRLPRTARIFVNEAEVPSIKGNQNVSGRNSPQVTQHNLSVQQFQKEHNLPSLTMAMDSSQGFLYEWWQVFWDVFQAKNGGSQINKQHLNYAQQYHQMQLLKQRQQQQELAMSLPGANLSASTLLAQQQPPVVPSTAMAVPPSAPQQRPLHLQQQIGQQFLPPVNIQLASQQQQLANHPNTHVVDQQRIMMMMKRDSLSQQQQQQAIPMNLDTQQQLATGAPNLNIQQQLFLQEQARQQQQLQQQPQKTRIQQHAQTQMNNLRQQVAAGQQQQLSNLALRGGSSKNSPVQKLSQVPQQGVSAGFQQQMNQQFSQQTPVMNGPQGQVPLNAQVGGLQQARLPNSGNSPNMTTTSHRNPSNTDALQDYQIQLMILEKQNKKRLEIARSSGTSDTNLMNLAPQAQQQAGGQTNQRPSPSTTNNSPLVKNKLSPSMPSKKYKKEPQKRGRKGSAASVAVATGQQTPVVSQPSSEVGGPDHNANITTKGNSNTPRIPKKEYSGVPLTPVSEPNETKRKRKGSAISESPKKQTTASKIIKKEKSITEEVSKENPGSAINETTKNEKDSGEGINSALNDTLGAPSDQIFNVELLGPTTSENSSNFFNPNTQPSQGALDDIDFDFNQFWEGNGGEEGLNDSIAGFNWGNVDTVENSGDS